MKAAFQPLEVWRSIRLGRARFDFIGKRRTAYAFSALLVLLGLFTLIQIARGKADLGIEFVGGASVQLKFERPVSLDLVREALAKGGLREAQPQQFAEGERILIRVKRSKVGPGGTADRIQEIVREAFSGNPFIVEGSTEIGPAIGKDLQKAALLAIVISLVGIITYIAWRFDFKFGIAATVATFHDVLTVLGIIALLGKEINLLIVTALLTIAGYSLTDTVVIYDRIRENLRGMRRESLSEIINVSINQVLARTVMTSITTFLAVFAIFSLGGEVLHDFALALLFGIIVGSYSSWFVAAALYFEWRTRQRAKVRKMAKARG